MVSSFKTPNWRILLVTIEVALVSGLLNVLCCSQEAHKYCIRMPNKWNFSFDDYYAAFLVLGIYVPGRNLLLCQIRSISAQPVSLLFANVFCLNVLQVVLTCTPICLAKGRELSRNRKRSRVSANLSNALFVIFLFIFCLAWLSNTNRSSKLKNCIHQRQFKGFCISITNLSLIWSC